jgi:ABC-type antimicrobial peptide transport system permease subunit
MITATLAAVAAVLGAAAMLASYIPAIRAARVNPVEALRAE